MVRLYPFVAVPLETFANTFVPLMERKPPCFLLRGYAHAVALVRGAVWRCENAPVRRLPGEEVMPVVGYPIGSPPNGCQMVSKWLPSGFANEGRAPVIGNVLVQMPHMRLSSNGMSRTTSHSASGGPQLCYATPPCTQVMHPKITERQFPSVKMHVQIRRSRHIVILPKNVGVLNRRDAFN